MSNYFSDFRLLGFSVLKGYQRAKFSAVKILNHNINSGQAEVLLTLPHAIQISATGDSCQTWKVIFTYR